MSNRRNRTRGNTPTLDRRIEQAVQAEIARRFTNPQGGTVQPIPQNVLNQMMAQQAPQSEATTGMWEPGAPIKPIPGMYPKQGPRTWQYPVGYNIGQLPRSTEITAFDTLRNLAMLYDGIGLCEQAWFDFCSKPELVIKPRPKLLVDGQGDPVSPSKIQATYGARIDKWEHFFSKPDPDNDQSLRSWMKMALKEVLEIDALSIYRHTDRIGRIYGLEIMDGSRIKPLLNERGRKPNGDFPAYEQFLHGVPAAFFRRDEILYLRETQRIDSPYGFSRVERIILRVNQALRKQNKDLSTFTDGNMPAGTLEPPDDGTTDWTPEQLLVYQEMWDGMLAGNDSIKARIKVIPPGAKFNKTDPDDIMTPFDQFLLNVTVAAFGITMSELGFTENVNKSSGETQEGVIYRRAMAPIMDLFSELFTSVMEADGETDLMATWKAFEEPEDFKTKSEAWDILVRNGTQSTSQAAYALGLKPLVETEPFIIVPGSGIVFTSDAMDPAMRQGAKDAKLAGYEQAQNPPEEGMNNEQGTQQQAQGTTGSVGGKTAGSGKTAAGAQGSGQKQAGARGANDTGAQKRSLDASLPGEPGAVEGAEISAEYRRWRERAISDVKAGKLIREFYSLLIPVDDKVRIANALRDPDITTIEDVKRVFEQARQEVAV
jgi:Phage portal protein